MGLKAKIEAVIYAAEEPVTLAQLAAVFAPEVLAGLHSQEDEDGPAIANEGEESVEQDEGRDVFPMAGDAAEDAEISRTMDVSAAADMADEAKEDAAAGTQPEGTTPSGDLAEQPVLPLSDLPQEKAKADRQRDRQVRAVLEQVLRELMADYATDGRGMEVREVAGGYRIATKAEYHDAVRAFVKRQKPPMKLSLQALETLAVVAYKQPITAPEVSEIRGVDSSGVLGGLIARKLVTTAGRKQVVGRPILYKTTKEFLLRFGLKNISDLPSIEEFEKMAAEMVDTDATAPSPETEMAPGPADGEGASGADAMAQAQGPEQEMETASVTEGAVEVEAPEGPA